VPTNALARLDHAVKALGECRSLDEVKRIHALAEAAEQYAKAEKLGAEAVGYAREIIYRASRLAGEMLAAMAGQAERATRGQPRKVKSPGGTLLPTPPQLADLGITRKESARWQTIAKIPPGDFEKLVKGEMQPKSEAALARAGRQPRDYEAGMDPESVRRRGCLVRVCRELVELGDPVKTAKAFREYGTDDLLTSAREAAEWLVPFIKEWTKGVTG
jgi:hypothetical protein